MPARLWVDVEDLFEYAAFNARLSGIQRVELELCRALVELDPAEERIGFIRHDPTAGSFRTVAWPELLAIGDRLGGQPVSGKPREAKPHGGKPIRQAAARRDGAVRRALKRIVFRELPPGLRQPLVEFLLAQRQAVVALLAFARACATHGWRLPRANPRDPAIEAGGFAALVRPGDVILVLGAIWYHPDYPGLIRAARERHGARFAVLIHDLILLRRPEWSDPAQSRDFGRWFTGVIGLADRVLAVSRASADEVESYAAAHGFSLAAPVRVIPRGTGCSRAPVGAAAPARALPTPGSYALIVATLEVRKNHILLFRVWRRLLDELPREQVPKLVFAGRVGWMVADLMQQLRNSDFLDGHIVLVEHPSDAELEALYEGCLFTLFPSFYEGWGLPVTESLAFGRPCITSNATSLPEAGGTLARHFDPDNATEAYDVVRAVLADPAALAAWRERIAREFRPTPWRETAAAVLDALQAC